MHLTRLRIHRFRNVEDANLALGPGAHIVQGRNAQGKTNLLEAIYYLVTGRSFRARQDADVLPWPAPGAPKGEGRAFIEGEVRRQRTSTTLSVEISAAGKRVLSDGKQLDRLGRLWGRLNAVLFTPADLALAQGGPAERRRFLNTEIAQIDPAYLAQLQRHERALRQRNALLKRCYGKGLDEARKTLSPYEAELVASGAKLFLGRARCLGRLDRAARAAYAIISSQGEPLEIVYRPAIGLIEPLAAAFSDAAAGGAGWAGGADESDQTSDPERDDATGATPARSDALAAIESAYAEKLDASLEQDIRMAQTRVGPHRDDFSFALRGRDAREFASQGQQRSCVLSLRLAEIELMADATGEPPVLLFDDIVAELDASRRAAFFEAVPDSLQLVITATDAEMARRFAPQAKLFQVEGGAIRVAEE